MRKHILLFNHHKQVEDPFKKLGPIAIFSARRHWTAPRNIRLQKGTITEANNAKCKCGKSSFNDDNEASCNICSKYTIYGNNTNNDGICSSSNSVDSFGINVRGDAPVIIANVDINSLADVSILICPCIYIHNARYSFLPTS